eukprot:2666690-Heterocapsa_arctica.AAC.1
MGSESAGQRLPGFNRDHVPVVPRLTGFRGRPIEPANMGTSGPLPGNLMYTEGARRPKGLSAFGITESNCDSHYETEQQEQHAAPSEGDTDQEMANRNQRLRNQMMHQESGAPWDMDNHPRLIRLEGTRKRSAKIQMTQPTM